MNGIRWMAFLLRSPLHGLLSSSTMLITVTGRKTGRAITVPVNYVQEGNTLWVISKRDRTWWRNLTGGAPVKLRLRGREVEAFAEAVLDEGQIVEHLPTYLRGIPLGARTLGVRLVDGKPEDAGLAAAARQWLMVRVEPQSACC